MKREAKTKNFKRLASSRTNDILNKLRILSNCSNRSSYEYSKKDINRIFDAIDQATKEAKSKFYFPDNENFKL